MPSQFLPQKTIALFEQEALNLPVYLRDALNDFEWQDLTVAVGAKYQLTHDQVMKLLVEVGMILYQVGDPQTFRADVQSRLGISVEVLDSVIRDIAERVFTPLHQHILENNVPTIEYLQSEVARMEHEQILESVLPESTDEDEAEILQSLGGQIPQATSGEVVSTPTLEVTPNYTGHDPYHEPVEKL